MIPIMEREFVDKNKWMDKQEFMDIMVVAQTTPGIFAIDMASHIGYKLKGVWGGIVGAIGIALPSIIAILIIAMFSSISRTIIGWLSFCRSKTCRSSPDSSTLFQDGKDCQHQQVQFWIPIVCCALIALPVFAVSPIYVIIAAGVLGWLYGRIIKRTSKKQV